MHLSSGSNSLPHNCLLTCYFSIEFNIGKQVETTFIMNEQYRCISKLLYECALIAERNMGQPSKGWKDQHP